MVLSRWRTVFAALSAVAVCTATAGAQPLSAAQPSDIADNSALLPSSASDASTALAHLLDRSLHLTEANEVSIKVKRDASSEDDNEEEEEIDWASRVASSHSTDVLSKRATWTDEQEAEYKALRQKAADQLDFITLRRVNLATIQRTLSKGKHTGKVVQDLKARRERELQRAETARTATLAALEKMEAIRPAEEQPKAV